MNAIVTGASKGIGKQIALLLSEQGINVIAISRHMYMVREFPEGGGPVVEGKGRVIPISIDITNASILKDKLIQVINKEFKGEVNIIINNAGLLINKPFDEFIGREINDIISVNFSGPAQLIAMTLPFLKKAQKAHVVNISSMGGFTGSAKFPGLSYYSASKAAIASLTENLAEEFKSDGISFNCLSLGAVNTEMLQKAFPDYKATIDADEMAEYIVEFATKGHKYYNGKVLPVTSTTP